MLMSSLMKGIASASIFSLAGFALGFFDHIWLSALMILVTMLISFWLRLKILRNEMHSHIVLGVSVASAISVLFSWRISSDDRAGLVFGLVVITALWAGAYLLLRRAGDLRGAENPIDVK